MRSVVIRKCRVRVIRRGGWSWGSDPRGLLAGILRALPALIEAALGEAPSDRSQDAPRSIDEEEAVVLRGPVRVRVPITLGELAALAQVLDASPGTIGRHSAAQRIAAAIEESLATQAAGRCAPPPRSAPLTATEETTSPSEKTPIAERTPAQVLLDRLESGTLDGWLSGFSEGALEAWIGHLRSAPATTRDLELKESEIETALDRLRHLAALPGVTRAGRLRAALTAAVRLAAQRGGESLLAQPNLWQAFDQVAGPLAAPARRSSPAVQTPVPRTRARAAIREDEDVAALPFLLLAPLGQFGSLNLLSPCLRAAGLEGALPAWAAGLAFKVLDPPQRGWLRPVAARSAAIFAGLDIDEAEPALGAFASRAGELLTPLDAALGECLIASHTAGALLLLMTAPRPSGGFVLFDGEGLAPIAWADRVEKLFGHIAACCGPPVECSEPESMRPLLDAEFVARPARLESANAARAVWGAIHHDRPAYPRSPESALERHFTLHAAAALSALSWTLFAKEGNPTAVEMLERFRTLTATVRVEEARVLVTLPLGRRRTDLERHGLFRPATILPWSGKRLEFSGG